MVAFAFCIYNRILGIFAERVLSRNVHAFVRFVFTFEASRSLKTGEGLLLFISSPAFTFAKQYSIRFLTFCLFHDGLPLVFY